MIKDLKELLKFFLFYLYKKKLYRLVIKKQILDLLFPIKSPSIGTQEKICYFPKVKFLTILILK